MFDFHGKFHLNDFTITVGPEVNDIFAEEVSQIEGLMWVITDVIVKLFDCLEELLDFIGKCIKVESVVVNVFNVVFALFDAEFDRI